MLNTKIQIVQEEISMITRNFSLINNRWSASSTETLQILGNSIQITESLSSPRVIKTHLPLEFLPPNILETCKVIFVCRTPKDCCVSMYNHQLKMPDTKFKGTFSDFAEIFLNGSVMYGSYWTMLKVLLKSSNFD